MAPFQAFQISAVDGYPLAARSFLAERKQASATIVVAGATGVPQRFYRRFAQSVAKAGFDVLTFDFRGLGESLTGSIRASRASFTDWAGLDLPAVVNHALSQGAVAVVGHSFGGHAFGQLANANQTLGLYTVATGAACSCYMTTLERLKVESMWRTWGPLVAAVSGHLPGWAWGGQSLPLGVFKQWKRWSRYPNYFFDDPELQMQPKFDGVSVPIVGVTASDDPWAPETSMKVFLSHYRSAPVTLEVHSPAEMGGAALGHMGHFKAQALPFFVPKVVRWVQSRLGDV